MEFSIIPFMDDYKISKSGIICNANNTIISPTPENPSMVILNNRSYSIIELLRLTFLSLHPIDYKYCGNKFKYCNVKFIIPELYVKRINDLYLKINDCLYKKIKEYPDYYISIDGTVYSSKTNILMLKKYNMGYPTVAFSIENRKSKIEKIHRLVYSTWNDCPLSELSIVHHRDNRKYNSSFYNLEKSTPFQNTRHAIIDGKKQTRYSITQIELFCQLYLEGYDYRKISVLIFGNDSEYKNIRSIIYRLKKGFSYIDIANKYDLLDMNIPSKKKLTDDEVVQICELINSGKSINSIAASFNVSWPTIKLIKDGKRWKNVSKNILLYSKDEGSTTIESIA